MTLTISLPVLILLCISFALFVGVTILCLSQGLFDRGGGYLGGIDAMFTIIIYAVAWAIPSLLAWAAWATWWRA